MKFLSILTAVLGLLLTSLTAEAALTPAQRHTLHLYAVSQPAFIEAMNNGDDQTVANLFNALATPDFVVWRTSVTQDEYQSDVSDALTEFAWNGAGGYIARSQGERDAWNTMFANPQNAVNPSRTNVINAFNDIFSGAGAQAVNNRTHLLSMSKRLATLAERILAVGTGTELIPARLKFEGVVTVTEASQIRVDE